MTIREQLESARQMLGHSLVLPTPPACNALLQRARAEGIAVGQLFVVSRRLHPGLRGRYERSSGDLWCHYGAQEPDGKRLLLQSLLVLLAHLKLHQPVPTTIEEDWGYEREAWRTASHFASAWGMPDVLPQQELEERLSERERFHAWHQAAGELAGLLDPFLARSASHALADMRQQRGWDDEQFEAALYGYSEQDEDNAAVLAFDRSVLRGTWSLPFRAKHEGPPFGDLTLPQNSRTVPLLRSALEAAAHGRARQVPRQALERKWLDDPLSLHFLRIDSDQEFASLIASCNAWLVEAFPDLAAEAMWWVYSAGTTPVRIYRLSVHYKPAWRDAPSSCPSTRELWILFPGHERGRLVEAAFQRYILCWLSVQELRCESLDDGLTMLWSWLNQEVE